MQLFTLYGKLDWHVALLSVACQFAVSEHFERLDKLGVEGTAHPSDSIIKNFNCRPME